MKKIRPRSQRKTFAAHEGQLEMKLKSAFRASLWFFMSLLSATAWATESWQLRKNLLISDDEKLQYVEKLIARNPRDAEAFVKRGLIYESMGRAADALRDYSRAIEIDDGCFSAHYHRAVVQGRVKLFKAALADYTKAIELSPKSQAAYLGRAGVYEVLESFSSAIADYTSAISLPSPPSEAYARRGECRRKMGDYAGAAEDFLTVTQLDPRNSDAYESLGRCRAKLKKLDDAMACYSKAIELYPWNADAFQGRAEISLARGKVKEAINDCTDALAIAPSMVSACVIRGLAYEKKKDYRRMAADFLWAIRLDPKDASNYVHLARAYISTGKLAEARQHTLTAIKLRPKNRQYRELLQKIDNLIGAGKR